MRYILNDEGYIETVSFTYEVECNNKTCTEYTGSVPAGYETLAEWSENANINAYKIVDGELIYDSDKDTELQNLWASQIQKDESETTIYTGTLKGGETISLSDKTIKRFLKVYVYVYAQTICYEIDTSNKSATTNKAFGSCAGISFDVSSGTDFYVSESSFNVNTKDFTHERVGFYSITDGTYTARLNNTNYYIKEIRTYN